MRLPRIHCAESTVTERGSRAKIYLARASCSPSQFCSSSAKQRKPWPWLSRSFVNSCDMTPPRRHVADVPPNSEGVAWHRAPGWNSASLHQCCGHLSPSTDTPHQKSKWFFFFFRRGIHLHFFQLRGIRMFSSDFRHCCWTGLPVGRRRWVKCSWFIGSSLVSAEPNIESKSLGSGSVSVCLCACVCVYLGSGKKGKDLFSQEEFGKWVPHRRALQTERHPH